MFLQEETENILSGVYFHDLNLIIALQDINLYILPGGHMQGYSVTR